MKLAGLLSLIALPSALAVTVAYDTVYDNAGASMATVACSDGRNGLLSRFPTFGRVPNFPNVGAAAAVTGWNSTGCGTCWRLTFEGRNIFVTAIDHASNGFVLSQKALDALTNNRAVEYGRIEATAAQVAASNCGL